MLIWVSFDKYSKQSSHQHLTMIAYTILICLILSSTCCAISYPSAPSYNLITNRWHGLRAFQRPYFGLGKAYYKPVDHHQVPKEQQHKRLIDF